MNSATLAHHCAQRTHLHLPSDLLAVLRRAVAAHAAHAAPTIQHLGKHATACIAHPIGCTITCEAGELWLTVDNEPTDVILEAGQSHHCDQASRLLIHALTDARLSVA